MHVKDARFDRLEAEQQERVREKLSDIVKETFVFPADFDYVSARFMALNKQLRPFFWPALHCLEKYLKALLLSFGVPVKKYGHNISDMARVLAAKDDILMNVKLRAVRDFNELESNGLWGSECPYQFIEDIEEYGGASNRYGFFGSEYWPSYLPKLDQLVHVLRSNLDGAGLSGTGKNGEYDYFAYEHNYYFAPKGYAHKSYYGVSGMGLEVSSLEIALKDGYGHGPIFERWATENINMSKKDIERLKKK